MRKRLAERKWLMRRQETCIEQETCLVNVGHLCETDGDQNGETLRVTFEMNLPSVERDASVSISVQACPVCVRVRSPDTEGADLGAERTCVRESDRLWIRWRQTSCCRGKDFRESVKWNDFTAQHTSDGQDIKERERERERRHQMLSASGC